MAYSQELRQAFFEEFARCGQVITVAARRVGINEYKAARWVRQARMIGASVQERSQA